MTLRAPDPRPGRSRAALENALRELIAERPLAQISVADITKRACVNRSTFYEHYTDVSDLAASACTAVFDELVASTSPADRGRTPPADRLAPLFAHVAQYEALYRALLGDDGTVRVHNHLLRVLNRAIHTQRNRGGDPAPAYDPASAFVAGALLGSIVDWLDHGCPLSPQEMSATVSPQLRGALQAAREREAGTGA